MSWVRIVTVLLYMWLFPSFSLARSPDRRHSLGDSVRPQFTKAGTETPAPRYTALSHPALNQHRAPTRQRARVLHTASGLGGFLWRKKTMAPRHGTKKRSCPVKCFSAGRSKDSPSTYSWSCFDSIVLRTYLVLQRSRSSFLPFSSQGIRQKSREF